MQLNNCLCKRLQDRISYKHSSKEVALQTLKNDGEVMKGAAINQDKFPGTVFNYLNVECDDGVTRTIDGERI